MLESYEEYLKRTNKPDKKESWINWKIEVYQYTKEKARKRAETQYYPISPIDFQQTVIGLNIVYLRAKNGMSQKKLATMFNLGDMVIHRWETGEYIPDASQINTLSRIFDVSQSDLLTKHLYEEES